MKFKDLKEGKYYDEAINEVSEDGVMIGDDEGNFNPEEPVTRGMLAQVVSNMKKAYNLKKKLIIHDLRKNDIQLTPHFKLSEFKCKDGSPIVVLNTELPLMLEVVRMHFKKSIYVNSGYRTYSYNKTLKGAAEFSQHLYGNAADVRINSVSVDELADFCENIGFAGVGRYYKDGFVHVHVGDYKTKFVGN